MDTTTTPASPPQLLVVDDDRSTILLLAAILEPLGQVQFAISGAEALERVSRNRPDLVLLDVEMPGMDGHAVCAELRSRDDTHDIPIIFVTALGSPEDETRALEAGAVDFIHKPFNAAVVRARVRTHLTLKRQSDELRETGVLLKRANDALQRSNRDLQQFAYLAAHDLQAPIDVISAYSGMLREECATALGATAKNYLGHVEEHALRMRTLVRDLLAYSRLDSETRPFLPVDLRVVLDEVLFLLAKPIEQAKAEVVCGALPVVRADRYQVSQLLTNLVGNGIKYNKHASPRVEVAATPEADKWIVSVKDNGIGIARQHHEQVFEIFRRLHSSDSYPGTGIGLAICQRIVSRHGGRIWVESEEGQGSAFHFTLPAAGEDVEAD